jgi:signal transduction histidine kinase
MNRHIKLRLAGLGLAVALMGALIVLVTLKSEQQAVETGTRLGDVDTESFRIADRFKDKLRYANDKMRLYASAGDVAAWKDFTGATEELKQWIGSQQVQLNSDNEKSLLKQMEAALAAYTNAAASLHERMQDSGELGASLAEYTSFFMKARHLNDLGQELARLHYELRNQLLVDVGQTLSQLRLSILGLVGLLFMFVLALAGVVYRGLIAPLHTKLVESQALAERQEKLASLGLLAAGVAHEIRNPLTAIKAALFLEQKKQRADSAERGELKVVGREILRLERIVNAFLQFARPSPPELVSIEAQTPLQDVQALFAEQLANTGIRLVREDSPSLPIKVDPSQIKQVLINLVQNAADSMSGPGVITLRARPDRQRLRNGETDVVVLEVSDTGAGIPAQVEKRLFDPFFTTKEEGTGLGLSIAARIVERHGGALQYQTRVQHGTTFGVVLPKASPSARPVA